MNRTTTMVEYLTAIRDHLGLCPWLPAPCSILIRAERFDPRADVQLDSGDQLAPVAGGLLSWADTLTDPTGEAWRVPGGRSVHLSVTGWVGGLGVKVYDAVPYTPVVFADLDPDDRRTVPLGELRAWALTVTGGAAA